MGHHHDHHHHHAASELSFDEKMMKLLEHWVKHNDDHAKSYREWAVKASDSGFEEAGGLLQEAAELTMKISEKFKEASRLIHRHLHD